MADLNNCAVCRVMRGMAFSAIGGGVAGFTALTLGMDKDNAIIAAFFGALGLVLLTSRNTNKKR